MPKYVKYLKDVVSNKTKLGDIKMVAFTEMCSLIMMSMILKKLKHLGSFTLHIQIGDRDMGHDFQNLGETIKLMPLSMFNTLGLGKLSSCFVVLQMVDRTCMDPKGIIEDVIIMFDMIIIPINFIILNNDVDNRVLIILGRPFFETRGALINVIEGTLTMRLDDEEVVCNVYKPLNQPFHYTNL